MERLKWSLESIDWSPCPRESMIFLFHAEAQDPKYALRIDGTFESHGHPIQIFLSQRTMCPHVPHTQRTSKWQDTEGWTLLRAGRPLGAPRGSLLALPTVAQLPAFDLNPCWTQLCWPAPSAWCPVATPGGQPCVLFSPQGPLSDDNTCRVCLPSWGEGSQSWEHGQCHLT